MTISFLVVSKDMKSTHFFSSSYVFERSTIFWNMVLFLEWYHGKKCISLPDKYECISIYLWWKQKKKRLTWNKEPGLWQWWRCQWDEWRGPSAACSGSGRCLVTVGKKKAKSFNMNLQFNNNNLQVPFSFSPHQTRGTFQTLNDAAPGWRSHVA